MAELETLLGKQKNSESIEQTYRRAIEINPYDIDAYDTLGVFLFEQKKYEDAEKIFRQAIEIKPDYMDAYHNLGIVLHEQKKHEAAEKIFRQAIEINPYHARIHFCLGCLLAERSNNSEAEKMLRLGVKLGSEYGPAHRELANFLYKNDRIDEAVEVLDNGYHYSDDPDIVLDRIKELSLDITNLEWILGDDHPYVVERQKELQNKLDKVNGKLKEALEGVASIPFPERKKIISKHLKNLEPLKGEVAPPLPDPDLSGDTYPLYVKRTDPFKHLEEVWGTWLVRYTPSLKQDYLDQKQLRERDPTLFTALDNRLKRIKNEHVRDYIPPYRSPFPS